MNLQSSSDHTRLPQWLISLVLFVLCVGGMAYLRLGMFPDRFIALTYGVPLLVCLWHRDARLLWAMTFTFLAMSAYKAFFLLGMKTSFDLAQWIMQGVNILVVTVSVHLILRLLRRLDERNRQLAGLNAELSLKAEEIARQNGELQAQSEELAEQNEELQQQREELAQQNEELEHQSEELQAQGEDLQHANTELTDREALLQAILTSVRHFDSGDDVLSEIAGALRRLLKDKPTSIAIVERDGEGLLLRHWNGPGKPAAERWDYKGSFAAIVMSEKRTAFVDLARRPDLNHEIIRPFAFRTVLATPLLLNGQIAGALKVYSTQPCEWNSNDLQIMEWIAAQCSMALDIVRLRQQLQQLNSSLEDTVRERTARLQEMVDELEHFSYTITHDMRAPLRAMQGFAGILEEEMGTQLNDEARDCLQRISQSAQRMDRLITDALSYSRAVQQHLTVVPVNLPELLQGIVHSYPSLQPPKATIRIHPELPWVMGNEAGLTQCFSNLLGNAVKFVEPGRTPEVTVRAEQSGELLRVWVEDNGIGIPEQAQSRLFHMFQRVSKAYEGTGIGLALVRKVAERMGGRVGLESKPGQGSRFWIELRPCAAVSPAPSNGKPDAVPA